MNGPVWNDPDRGVTGEYNRNISELQFRPEARHSDEHRASLTHMYEGEHLALPDRSAGEWNHTDAPCMMCQHELKKTNPPPKNYVGVHPLDSMGADKMRYPSKFRGGKGS